VANGECEWRMANCEIAIAIAIAMQIDAQEPTATVKPSSNISVRNRGPNDGSSSYNNG